MAADARPAGGWLPRLGLLTLAALPAAAWALDDPYLLSLLSRGLILAMAAVSLDRILGYGAMVSFGHAAFVGAGAYTVGILAHHATQGSALWDAWPWLAGTESALVAWPAAMAVAGLLAAAIGALSLRTRGLYFIMITLAFGQMFYYFAINFIADANFNGFK